MLCISMSYQVTPYQILVSPDQHQTRVVFTLLYVGLVQPGTFHLQHRCKNISMTTAFASGGHFIMILFY
jgi:hypothetical protein